MTPMRDRRDVEDALKRARYDADAIGRSGDKSGLPRAAALVEAFEMELREIDKRAAR